MMQKLPICFFGIILLGVAISAPASATDIDSDQMKRSCGFKSSGAVREKKILRFNYREVIESYHKNIDKGFSQAFMADLNALYFHLKSANRGDAYAQVCMGIMYENNHLVAKD